MRGLVVLLVVGCGKIGFDPTSTADVGYFVSPSGDDGNPGTRTEPWQTFAYAIPQLVPGDRLTLLDATYDVAGPSGPLTIDCSAGAPNGTAAAPIVVRADHPRAAHVTNPGSALSIDKCTGWEVDDILFEGSDVPLGIGTTPLVHVNYSASIVLRGLMAVHPNRYDNNHGVEIGHSNDVLVEDVEVYDVFRQGFNMYLSTAVTFRRMYVNGRGAADIAGGYTSSCPGADVGGESYYSSGGVIEDSIVEDVCGNGFGLTTGRVAAGDTGLGDHHTYSHDIALGPGETGFEVFTDCDATDACDTPDRICSDNTISGSASIGFMNGFLVEGIANALDHDTAIGMDNDVLIEKADATGVYAATAFITASLGQGAANGVVVTDQTSWSVTSSNMFGATVAYMPNDNHIASSTTIDPQLGSCQVYLPAGSPMLGAGPSGSAIGADIRTQTQDGMPTTTPYWRSDGTFAGCGAIVPGVNDDPATSCIGVHQRLNVGTNGCALP